MDKEKLIAIIKDFGISKVGFSDLSEVSPKNHLRTGITIVVRLSEQIIDDIDLNDGPTHTYFHHYRTVNAFIDQVTLRVTNILQDNGFLAMAVPASQSVNIDGWSYNSLFPHKTAATLSGIGWIGNNCCLVTDEYGPRIRLGTILTNMPTLYDKPIVESKCTNCNKCVKACPAMALKGTLWNPSVTRDKMFDAKACSQHMHYHYQKIGRGSVCGICLMVCPKGKRLEKRVD